MKKYIWLLMLMAGVSLTAQRKKKQTEKLHRYTPEQSANLQANRLSSILDLTEEQQAEVKDLLLQTTVTRKEKNIKAKNYKKELKSILTEDQYHYWEKLQEPKNVNAMDKPKNKIVDKPEKH